MSMFVLSSKTLSDYGTKIAANPLAEERATNAILSSFHAKIGAFGWPSQITKKCSCRQLANMEKLRRT
jgi:hypothetical protein